MPILSRGVRPRATARRCAARALCEACRLRCRPSHCSQRDPPMEGAHPGGASGYRSPRMSRIAPTVTALRSLIAFDPLPHCDFGNHFRARCARIGGDIRDRSRAMTAAQTVARQRRRYCGTRGSGEKRHPCRAVQRARARSVANESDGGHRWQRLVVAILRHSRSRPVASDKAGRAAEEELAEERFRCQARWKTPNEAAQVAKMTRCRPRACGGHSTMS